MGRGRVLAGQLSRVLVSLSVRDAEVRLSEEDLEEGDSPGTDDFGVASRDGAYLRVGME